MSHVVPFTQGLIALVKLPRCFWTTSLLFGLQIAAAQSTPWLTDEKARDVAGAAIHSEYPQPCYSTYRNERLESWLLGLRASRLAGNQLNNSVYFYRVASDVCDYVIAKDGKPEVVSLVSMDCCDYGLVAVDRAAAKSYWFSGKKKAADVFKELVRDEQLQPDSSKPTIFTALYLELVWGEHRDMEIESVGQLRDLVQNNLQSAYSPYERDNRWQRQFDIWWRKFRSRVPQLKLETTYESADSGTIVRGYAFSGFELTTPRSDPPPKGTPKLFQWNLLVKPDGTVEENPPKVIYSSR